LGAKSKRANSLRIFRPYIIYDTIKGKDTKFLFFYQKEKNHFFAQEDNIFNIKYFEYF